MEWWVRAGLCESAMCDHETHVAEMTKMENQKLEELRSGGTKRGHSVLGKEPPSQKRLEVTERKPKPRLVYGRYLQSIDINEDTLAQTREMLSTIAPRIRISHVSWEQDFLIGSPWYGCTWVGRLINSEIYHKFRVFSFRSPGKDLNIQLNKILWDFKRPYRSPSGSNFSLHHTSLGFAFKVAITLVHEVAHSLHFFRLASRYEDLSFPEHLHTLRDP
jgi:hypothetical protein